MLSVETHAAFRKRIGQVKIARSAKLAGYYDEMVRSYMLLTKTFRALKANWRSIKFSFDQGFLGECSDLLATLRAYSAEERVEVEDIEEIAARLEKIRSKVVKAISRIEPDYRAVDEQEGVARHMNWFCRGYEKRPGRIPREKMAPLSKRDGTA